MGVAVDAYMNFCCSDFDGQIATHEAQIKDKFSDLSHEESEWLAGIAKTSTGELVRTCAHRWAYLDALGNDVASKEALTLLESRDPEAFVSYIRVAKNMAAGPISASVGGPYVWGPHDITLSRKIERQVEETEYSRFNEQLKFLVSELADIEPFQIVSEINGRSLLKFVEEKRNLDARDRVIKACDDLAKLVSKEALRDPDVSDFRDAIDDYRGRLASAGFVGTLVAGGVGALAGYAVHNVVPGALSGGLGFVVGGGLAGAALEKLKDKSASTIGRVLFKTFNHRADRVISTIDWMKK
jgi:hypothetical protein